MNAINWLAAASAAIWLGIGGYLIFLANRQKLLDLKIKRLEIMGNDSDK